MKRRINTLLQICLTGWIVLAGDRCIAASCNTVVRFQIRYGPHPFGEMDVELFDFDKPVTVSNFLYQVRSGAYDRSFIHRLVPNFILQGGLYTVRNPNIATLFLEMERIPAGPPITNEFNRALRISNTFGTLAMALSSTNIGGIDYPLLNSATTSWFFNTAGNAALLDPNFTVFGRVVAGSEVLSTFNTFTEDSGIINMLGLTFLLSACEYPNLGNEGQVALPALPVAYFIFDCPGYSDLFNVQITIIQSVGNEVCLSGPTRTGEQLRWSFFAREGYNYDVQHTDELNPTNWKVLQTIVGDDSTKSFTVPATNRAQFYRVVRR